MSPPDAVFGLMVGSPPAGREGFQETERMGPDRLPKADQRLSECLVPGRSAEGPGLGSRAERGGL